MYPPNIKAQIQTEGAGAHSQHMLELKASRGVSNAIVRYSAAKQFDEPGAAEARAIDKVLNLPKFTNPS